MVGQRVYGRTAKGEPCKRCLKQNGYCYQHKDQDRHSSHSYRSSSNQGGGFGHAHSNSGGSQGNKIYGYTQKGLPCKRCINKGDYCHFHEDQRPSSFSAQNQQQSQRSSYNSQYKQNEHPQWQESTGSNGHYGYYNYNRSPPPPPPPPPKKTFGVTQDGNPCKNCIRQGCYCYQHQDQYREKLKKRAEKWYAKGDYKNAAMYFGAAAKVKLSSGGMGLIHATLYDRRADCWMKLQKYEDAIQDWTYAISIFPTYCAPWKKRGRCQYRNMNKTHEAISDLETWLNFAVKARCNMFSMEDISDHEMESIQFELRELKNRQAYTYSAGSDGKYENSHQYNGFHQDDLRDSSGGKNANRSNFNTSTNGSRSNQKASTSGGSYSQWEGTKSRGRDSNYTRSDNTSSKQRWSSQNTSSSNYWQSAGFGQGQSSNKSQSGTRSSYKGTSWQSTGRNANNSDGESRRSYYGGTGSAGRGPSSSGSSSARSSSNSHGSTGNKDNTGGSNSSRHDQSKSTQEQEKVDHYKTLGVSKDASSIEIKKAHRKLALQFHPDKTGDPGSSEKFRLIQEAYEVLRDDDSRRRYDMKMG